MEPVSSGAIIVILAATALCAVIAFMGSVIDQKNRELAANAQRHAPQELADAYKTGRQEALSEAIKWAEKSARLQVGEDEVAREAYHRMADALSEMKNGPSPQG